MFSVVSLRWFLRLDVGVPNRSNLGLSVRHHRAICSIFHSFCFCVMIFSLCASNSTTSTRTSKWKSARQVLKKRQNVNIKMSDYLLVWCLILCPNSWFWDSNQSIFETPTLFQTFWLWSCRWRFVCSIGSCFSFWSARKSGRVEKCKNFGDN